MSQNFDIPKQMFAIVTTGNGGFDKLSHKIEIPLKLIKMRF